MRKQIVPAGQPSRKPATGDWLDVEALAEIEITSEDPEHPIDSAVVPESGGSGWRASNPGEQMIRICFLEPQTISRIQLVFEEKEVARTQELLLRWLPEDAGDNYRDVVRQQYNFSPPNTTQEREDFRVNLEKVKALELTVNPDISRSEAFASLKELRLA